MEKPPVQFPWEIPPQVYGPFHVRLTREDGRERSNVSGLGERHGRADNFIDAPNVMQGRLIVHLSNSCPPTTTKYTQGLSNAMRRNTNWFRKVPPRRVMCSLRIYWRVDEK